MISFSHFIKIVILCLILTYVIPGNCLAQEPGIKNGQEIKKRVEGLNTAGLLQLFGTLNDADKQDLFSALSNTQRQHLLQQLADNEKQKIFQTLDDTAKNDLFSIMNNRDRQLILSNLSQIERSRLINSLSTDEKKELLTKYPELGSGIDLLDDNISEDVIGTQKDDGLSRIEKIFSGQISPEIDKELHQFGYNFFRQKYPFSPEKNIPVGPEYIIGPQDSFTVHLWGKVEETHVVTVSRDGGITLPRLGTLVVGGLTFSELKKFLNNKYKEYYPDFTMSITMDALKSIDVYMVGELNRPGTYNLSSLSTVVSALSASGGPSKNGTLRKINILSNGELLKTIDLYDFFINGLKENDITLKQGYTVFVPVIGPTAAVSGHVKRPAVYEMKNEQTLDEIIKLAGGVLPTSRLQNVIIERIIDHTRRVVVSFDLDPLNKETAINLKTVIKDGDLIKIYPVHKNIEKIVYLEGNVKYPNEYELKDGMRIKDIIPSYDYLLPEPYLAQAEIIRLVPPDLHPEIKTFNLGAMLDGDESQNLALEDRDRIKIYNAWEKQNIPEVSISGALRMPGFFRLYEGMTIKDLIFAAGNTTRNAYLTKGELTRIVSGESGTDIIKINFSPQKAIEGNSEDNLNLQADDQVYIREMPKYNSSLERRVYLEGEFQFPGEYSFSEGEKISSVIERAGGLTEEAYPYGTIFTRESAKEIWAARKQEYIDKLEEDIFTVSAFTAESALDSDQAKIAIQTLNAKREMLEKLKQAKPTGRMVINLSDVIIMPSGSNDLELRPGDRLVVGKRPDSVFVIGEVYNPNAIIYTSRSNVSDYLNIVGGITDNADKKQIYIVRADGTVISKKQSKLGLFNWDSSNHRWGFGSFNSIELNPGDTIIVPKKIIKFGWMKFLKDTTSIIYNIAVSAGVLDDILDN